MERNKVELNLKVKIKDGLFTVRIKENINENQVRCEWYSTDRKLQSEILNIEDLIEINNYFNLKYKKY